MIRAMLAKEFLLILRDKQALLALFVMPAIFILIMSLALKDVFSESRALIHYSAIDKDQSTFSKKFLERLRSNPLLSEEDGSTKEKIQFILIIPKGYSEASSGGNGEAYPLTVEAAADVKQDLLALFKSQLVSMLMQEKIAGVKARAEGHPGPMSKMLEGLSFDEKTMLKVQFSSLKKDERPNSTQQSVPTWIVFGMFFVIIPVSTIFINERKQNTLLRLLSMNVSTPLLFFGKIVPYMLINQLQVWVMIAVGIYLVPLFGADALMLQGSVPALILVSLALSLSAIGLSMLIAVSVKTVEQATTIGGILNVLLGAIGGVMVPKFVMPDFMQTFSNISPMSWGLEGFLDLLLRRGGIGSILSEVAALTLFGVVLLVIAAMIFKIQTRRGL